jgi:ketosteroid isomerase-like protein
VDAVMAFFAQNCVLEMPRGPNPWGSRHQGFTAVRTALKSRFDGIPDVHYGDDQHYVVDDTGISKWTLRGTVAATGRPIEERGYDFFDFHSRKVVWKDSHWKIVEAG